jgi:hypothetical protein
MFSLLLYYSNHSIWSFRSVDADFEAPRREGIKKLVTEPNVVRQRSFSSVESARAAAICENLLRVKAVEIDLGHVQPRSNDTPTGNNEALASGLSSTERPEDGSGDAVMI